VAGRLGGWLGSRLVDVTIAPRHSNSSTLALTLEQALIGEPKGAVVFHHAHRVSAGRNLGQAEILEADLVQAREQLAAGILLLEEVMCAESILSLSRLKL
jgi:hypothetical protein